MTLTQINQFFNNILKKENYSFDPSRNGIQIQNSSPDSKEIKKVAFAVDACEATAKLAAEQGADLLFCHHGIFWDNSITLTESMYKRVKPFFDNDLALCAYHIPLDANDTVGNNIGLCKMMNLKNIKHFGQWRGMDIGYYGTLEKELSVDECIKLVLPEGQKPNVVLKFGKEKIKTVGIISGGAGSDLDQAWRCGCDLYITGEIGHENFHTAKELGINAVACGHYNTETVGPKLMMKKLSEETGIQTVFIDCPTGL